MKSTVNGKLSPILNCYIKVPGQGKSENDGTIVLNNLPDISDSKSAIYNQEAIIGRSAPLYTYSHSGDRVISMQLHFFVVEPSDAENNLYYLRLLESAVYPQDPKFNSTPFNPPPVCSIKCGKLLDKEELCVVLQSYNVKFPTEVAWDEETFVPFRFDVDTSWLVVYDSVDLPFQNRIIASR